MTKQQFKDKAIENAAQIVNYIANHEYAKLHTVTNIKTSLYGDAVTLEMIGEWLEEQLKICSEYENKEFVIDAFEEKYFKILELKDNRAFAYFNPHSYNERFDFVFEFDFIMDDNGNITSEFSVNM